MAEEVRFFLRTALYSAVIALVYWFASRAYEAFELGYDWAGTTLLVFIVLACGVMSGGVLLFARYARHGPSGAPDGGSRRGVGAKLDRLIGLGHPQPGLQERPLAGGPDRLPAASAWPIVSAVAATLILLGLVYGPWLIAPGVVLLVIGAGGWLRE